MLSVKYKVEIKGNLFRFSPFSLRLIESVFAYPLYYMKLTCFSRAILSMNLRNISTLVPVLPKMAEMKEITWKS